MEPLARLDSNSILAEDIFLEIFDQEDEIMKARMILSLTDRAAEHVERFCGNRILPEADQR